MTSQPGQETIAIHKLTNISRSNDNQAKKFAQLIEHNMRNIFEKFLKTFLKNHTQCGGETIFSSSTVCIRLFNQNIKSLSLKSLSVRFHIKSVSSKCIATAKWFP